MKQGIINSGRSFFMVLCLLLSITLNAQVQENSVVVQQIVSPKNNTFFNSVDSFDIVIRIRNLGPQELLAGDQFKISYSIGDGGVGSQSFDTLIQVGDSTSIFNQGGMKVNQLREFVIANNYKINGDNVFAVCADVRDGTVVYPNNPEKDAGKCVQFTVGLEKLTPSISKLFYANNAIHFNLTNSSDNLVVEVYDITGKTLVSKPLKAKLKQSVPLGNPVKGFYFLKVINQKGNNVTAKFVVN